MAQENKIGALWSKKGPKGDYMTGEIELNGQKTKIVVFYNSHKEKENQPDWNILISKPKEQEENSLEDVDTTF